MKIAAAVCAAAVLFVTGVLIGTGSGRSSPEAPPVVELGRAAVIAPSAPRAPTPTAPSTTAPVTAATPTTAAPPATSTPSATGPGPPETVERSVQHGGLDDYGDHSGKGSGSSGSGSSGSGSGP